MFITCQVEGMSDRNIWTATGEKRIPLTKG